MSQTVSQPLSQRLVRNTIFNSLGRASGLLGALLITPYVLSILGNRMFGLWSLILALTGYLEVFDFGLRPVFMKYVAEYHLLGNAPEINRLLTAGLVLVAGLGAVVLAAVFFLTQPLMRWWGVETDLFALAATVIPLAVAAFYVRILGRLLEAVMWGLQRMDVSNSVAVLATAVQLAGTVWVLQAGYGLVGLVIVRGIVALVSVALLGIVLVRMLPALQIGPRHLRRASFGTLLRYGSKIQVTKLAELAYVQGDKLFLGYFVGLPAVAFYELASRLVQGARFLSVIVTSAVVPAASELDAGGEKESLRVLYRRASKYLVLVAAPLNLFPAALAPWLVLAWLGAGYHPVVVLLQALAVGHFVHVLTASGTTLVQGIGLPEVETRFALLLLAINVVLSFVLIGRFGFNGVLFATPLALILGSAYFWWSLRPIVGVRVQELWGQIYAFPTIVCLIVGGLVYVAGLRLSPGTLAGGHRLEATAITLGVGLGMSVAYGLIMWGSAYLDGYDRRLLSGLARQLVDART